ncbi:hypothetical protein C7N43_02235 [Sphingobacteriales bacterium UPWRP_1]|nr:hypothetical protein B6N25_07315 [Sphingobacteriales bacterium TSM_CSS]PSJ78703.1 hypothetical protein C7N43_02235 [Sphingobacteriales bacterium UPWRP_1]
MNRREFLRNAALAATGSIVAPYILPSGRLFAQTGSQLAQHVVLVMCAGGIRHQESIGQRYLFDAQYTYTQDPDLLDLTGNIMPNLFVGSAPADKIVYGSGSNGQTPIAPILGQPLQMQGTVFAEATAGSASHYIGLSQMLSGNLLSHQGLKMKPLTPTIFEYVRRFMNPQTEGAATKVWFIGNTIGNSVPLLNYGLEANYGAKYGANFFAPTVTFGEHGRRFLAAAKNYHPEEDFGRMYEMRNFLNNSFLTTGGVLESLGNTPEEKYDIKQFMKKMFDADFETIMQYVPENPNQTGNPENVPVINRDVSALVYATEVMDYFEPTLIALNLDGADSCHSNFTSYLQALHRQDYAVGYLWNFIQNHPVFRDNTIMIVAPECGRNEFPNALKDTNDWYAYDHSDWNAARTWIVMAGPNVPQNLLLQSPGNNGNQPIPVARNTQITLTIAEILGIRQDVANAGFTDSQSLFDVM